MLLAPEWRRLISVEQHEKRRAKNEERGVGRKRRRKRKFLRFSPLDFPRHFSARHSSSIPNSVLLTSSETQGFNGDGKGREGRDWSMLLSCVLARPLFCRPQFNFCLHQRTEKKSGNISDVRKKDVSSCNGQFPFGPIRSIVISCLFTCVTVMHLGRVRLGSIRNKNNWNNAS